MMRNDDVAVRARLLADAGRCVKCALCLPHCPTYRLKGEEGDSPRGRIALIQALADGSLEPTAATREHLEGCLTCRACEAVCPAGVPYGRLIDAARAELPIRGRASPLSRLARRAAAHPAALGVALRVGSLLSALPFPRPLRAILAGARVRRAWLRRGPPDGPPLQLFLGCVARALDGDALAESAYLLAAAGYRIEVPRGQTCCGALAMHAGESAAAARLARRNLAAFAGAAPVVGTASACTVQLREYDQILTENTGFTRRVTDAGSLFAAALDDGRLLPRSDLAPVRVALHAPCTQRNVLRSDGARRCLAALPGVETVPLAPGCCGAAGSYFLDRPADAAALRAPLLEAIADARADCVVTTNLGCRLHLQAGLGGARPRVLHLATFLAQRLQTRP